jgi:hypothetical protein
MLFKNHGKAPPLLFVLRALCLTYGTRKPTETPCFLKNYVVLLNDSSINKLQHVLVSQPAYRIDTLRMRSLQTDLESSWRDIRLCQ